MLFLELLKVNAGRGDIDSILLVCLDRGAALGHRNILGSIVVDSFPPVVVEIGRRVVTETCAVELECRLYGFHDAIVGLAKALS